jgi:hypothetical protein
MMRNFINIIQITESEELGTHHQRPERIFSKKNISALSLVKKVEASREHKLRGICDDAGNIYWWDAFYATHDEAAKQLGIPYHIEHRLFAYIDSYGDTVIDQSRDTFRFLKSLAESAVLHDINISILGWRSRWTAEEYLEQLADYELLPENYVMRDFINIMESYEPSNYGYWIRPDGVIQAATYAGHEVLAAQQLGFNMDQIDDDDEKQYVQMGMEEGGVRVVVRGQTEFSAEWETFAITDDARASLRKLLKNYKDRTSFIMQNEYIESYAEAMRYLNNWEA